MIRIHAACLPAFCPPALTKSPNPATAERPERLISSPPTKREGVKKGSFGSCFGLSTFHREAVKQYPQSPAERGRTIILIPSPHTRPPAPSQTHAHLCPPTTTMRLLLLSRNEQKSMQRIKRKFRPLRRRGHLERPDPTQCHRHSGDVISEGKNIMQHYLPLQVAQTERACTCLQTFCILKTHTQFHSGTEHINKNVAGVEKLTLEEEKANSEDLTAELKMMHQCPCLCCISLELYYSCGHTIKQIKIDNSK